MKKKYIMITGSSHSGSTLLGAILGNFNDGRGVDVGEIYVLFDPDVQYSMSIDTFWSMIEEKCSKDTFLEFLFQRFDCVVDSSKLLSWYKTQRKIADGLGVDISHIHVFRHPIAWYNSRKNRNQVGDFEFYIRHNINPLSWHTPELIVYLPDLRQNPITYTRKMCKELDIPYWEKKHEYWNSSLSGLFGSSKARKSREITKPNVIEYSINVPDQVMNVYHELMDKRLR